MVTKAEDELERERLIELASNEGIVNTDGHTVQNFEVENLLG